MYQTATNRSRQLLYVAFAAAAFSILSMGYKHFSDTGQDRIVGQLDCVPDNTRDIVDSACNEISIDDKAHVSSLGQ